jgi:flagellar FliJ protein
MMPKFVFQLDGVLRQRENLEQQRQRELAVAQARFQQMDAELRAMDRAVKDATADVRQHHLRGVLNMAYLAAHRRYTLAVERKAMTLIQRMAIAQRQVDDARAKLAEAAKDRKVIEKLREKQYERWREAVARRELADLDEVNMQLSYQEIRQQETE